MQGHLQIQHTCLTYHQLHLRKIAAVLPYNSHSLVHESHHVKQIQAKTPRSEIAFGYALYSLILQGDLRNSSPCFQFRGPSLGHYPVTLACGILALLAQEQHTTVIMLECKMPTFNSTYVKNLRTNRDGSKRKANMPWIR